MITALVMRSQTQSRAASLVRNAKLQTQVSFAPLLRSLRVSAAAGLVTFAVPSFGGNLLDRGAWKQP